MGKTIRRNPYARDLEKKQYRGRIVRDKRKETLEKLNAKDAEEGTDWTPYVLVGAVAAGALLGGQGSVGPDDVQGPETTSEPESSTGSEGGGDSA